MKKILIPLALFLAPIAVFGFGVGGGSSGSSSASTPFDPTGVAYTTATVRKVGDTMTGALVVAGASITASGPAGNIISGASVTASALFGNGAGITGALAPASVTLTGPAGNLTSGSSVTASAFFGNGSQLTNLPAGTEAVGFAGPKQIGSTLTLTNYLVGGSSFVAHGFAQLIATATALNVTAYSYSDVRIGTGAAYRYNFSIFTGACGAGMELCINGDTGARTKVRLRQMREVATVPTLSMSNNSAASCFSLGDTIDGSVTNAKLSGYVDFQSIQDTVNMVEGYRVAVGSTSADANQAFFDGSFNYTGANPLSSFSIRCDGGTDAFSILKSDLWIWRGL